MIKSGFREVMDCIHLKACRRYSKILRSKGISIARGCNDTCTAYQSIEDFKDENNFYCKAITTSNSSISIDEKSSEIEYIIKFNPRNNKKTT